MARNRNLVSPIGRTGLAARRLRAARSAAYRSEANRLAPFEVIARMVIARRIRYGLTQHQLAVRMGTSLAAISRLESGRHRPSLQTLEKLADAFGERLVVGFEGGGERETHAIGR